MITIETNIPPPKDRRKQDGRMAELRTTLQSMNIGDSFMVTDNNKHCYQAAREIDVKIATRKQNQGGWRVWRVK